MKMPKLNLSKQLKHLERLITDNSPMILTAIGVIGVAGTAGLTWKAATDAEVVIADHAGQKNLQREPNDPYYTSKSFTAKEKFGLTWKLYIAPVTAGVLTCGCIIAAQKINARRAAAIAGVLAMTQDNLKEYKNKVEEKLTGPKKREVKEELAQERANRAWTTMDPEDWEVGEGEVLVVEDYTGRVFSSTRNKIEKAEIDINRRIIDHDAACLSEFYDIIGLEHTAASEDFGWNSTSMLEVDFVPVFTPKHKKPAMLLQYVNPPMMRPWEAGKFRERR